MKHSRRVPVIREALSDLDTPLSVYGKLAWGPNSFLLESVQGGEQWGRYSIIGPPAHKTIQVRGKRIERYTDGELSEAFDCDDPLAWIAELCASVEAPELPGLPRLNGGLVDYFGAATIGLIEPRLAAERRADALDVPDICLLQADELVVFDNLRGRLSLVVFVEPGNEAQAETRLDTLCARLAEPVPAAPLWRLDTVTADLDFSSEFAQADFEAAVGRVREYILAGDAMQVVLSQRLSAEFGGSSLDLYRALRSLNPSPYLYFLDFGDFQIAGSSPEVMVRLEEREVTVRPIAGTRPRGLTPADDRALERDLLADPKECAEHLMLIDLGRNDIGRIAESGSVVVSDQMTIEHYSHVMHIVSNVTGRLREGLGPIDVLKATFPAGTLSGAPKIRALEIIAELEPIDRRVYSGAVGYIAWNGSMDTAIAIRTAVIKDGRVFVQAGAGIVADSDPSREWEETMNKARAVLRAAALAQAVR